MRVMFGLKNLDWEIVWLGIVAGLNFELWKKTKKTNAVIFEVLLVVGVFVST